MKNQPFKIRCCAAFLLVTMFLSACNQPVQVTPPTTRQPAGGAITVSTPYQAVSTPAVIKTCTTQGCGQTLIIKLSGTIPPDSTLEVKGADGATATVHCASGRNASASDFTALPFQPVCSASQVSFTGFTPKTVTILVTWGSQSMTVVAAPVYETLQPNGPGCDPACQVGTIDLNFK